MDNSSQYNDQDLKQLELAYTYAEATEKLKSEVLDDLNRRLTTMLGFSGILIRFTLDLPHGCPSTLLFKFLAIITSATAAIHCAHGLTGKPTGLTTEPEVLVESDEWIERDAEINKIALTKGRIQSISDMYNKAHDKDNTLKSAIGWLIAAVIVFAINLVLATFIQECS